MIYGSPYGASGLPSLKAAEIEDHQAASRYCGLILASLRGANRAADSTPAPISR